MQNTINKAKKTIQKWTELHEVASKGYGPFLGIIDEAVDKFKGCK